MFYILHNHFPINGHFSFFPVVSLGNNAAIKALLFNTSAILCLGLLCQGVHSHVYHSLAIFNGFFTLHSYA